MKLFTRLLIFTALFSFFAISSCQKPLIDPNPTTPNSPLLDSTLLSMYVELDTTFSAPLDTTVKIVYTYDNLKRNTDYNYVIFNAAGLGSTGFKMHYTYNGSDSLIASGYFIDYGFKDTSINYYTYNSNLEIVKDSFVHLTTYSKQMGTSTFFYGTNNVTEKRVYSTFNYGSSSQVDSFREVAYLTKLNNNIVMQRDSIYLDWIFRGAEDYTLSYDNHPNPFHSLYIKYPYLTTTADNDASYVQKNNLLATSSIGFNYNYVYQYQYKPNGYPLQVNISGTAGNLPSHSKGFYFYTR